ncbi:hypothetical protein BC938DRAFT_481530, partial [Jimgerdemannia flammicorona]
PITYDPNTYMLLGLMLQVDDLGLQLLDEFDVLLLPQLLLQVQNLCLQPLNLVRHRANRLRLLKLRTQMRPLAHSLRRPALLTPSTSRAAPPPPSPIQQPLAHSPRCPTPRTLSTSRAAPPPPSPIQRPLAQTPRYPALPTPSISRAAPPSPSPTPLLVPSPSRDRVAARSAHVARSTLSPAPPCVPARLTPSPGPPRALSLPRDPAPAEASPATRSTPSPGWLCVPHLPRGPAPAQASPAARSPPSPVSPHGAGTVRAARADHSPPSQAMPRAQSLSRGCEVAQVLHGVRSTPSLKARRALGLLPLAIEPPRVACGARRPPSLEASCAPLVP